MDLNQSFDDGDDQLEYGAPVGNGKAPTGNGKVPPVLGAQARIGRGLGGAGGYLTGQVAASPPEVPQFADAQAVLNQELINTLVAMKENLQDRSNQNKKRKKDSLDDLDEEEENVPVKFVNLDGEDDGQDKICWEIRTQLPPFNGDQDLYWSKQPRVRHPIKASVNAEHLRMDPVNSRVTLRDHDRGAPRTIKQYSKDNIRVMKTKIQTDARGMEKHDIGLVREYVECQGVYQVMSAIHQYQSNLTMIRPDDWSGSLMIRILHDVKYFLPIIVTRVRGKVERDKKQLELITWFADQVLDRNSMRGRSGKSPLKYEEVRAIAVSASNLLFGGSGIGLGWDMDMASCTLDPYTAGAGGETGGLGVNGNGGGYGGGSGNGGGGGNRTRGKGRGRGGGQQVGGPQVGGAGLGGGGQQQPQQQPQQQTQGGGLPVARNYCRDWNKGACPYPNSCKYFHFCNKVVIYQSALMDFGFNFLLLGDGEWAGMWQVSSGQGPLKILDAKSCVTLLFLAIYGRARSNEPGININRITSLVCWSKAMWIATVWW